METPTTFTAPELVSDLAFVAQYADAELTAQIISSTTVSNAPNMSNEVVDPDDQDDDSDSSQDEAAAENEEPAMEDSSDTSSDEEEDNFSKVKEDIDAAMIEHDKEIRRPLTTEHEIVVVPVREPSVELTADFPIAQCGRILHVSVPGLMMTVQSNPSTKTLDEGSVLCLEDRTVIGCVDEIFGPVLMPMYLVRFKTADKMPMKAAVNAAVYNATEHTTYIIPDKIKDKGSDASNLFDEEEDEPEFSDDEAEAVAKRSKRRRNQRDAQGARNGNTGAISSFDRRRCHGRQKGRGGRGLHGHRDNASIYHTRQKGLPHGDCIYYGQQPLAIMTCGMSSSSSIQTQPHGGVTKFTQPVGFGGLRPPLIYGTTNYTFPQVSQSNIAAQQPTSSCHVVNMLQEQAQRNSYYIPPPPSIYSAHNQPSCQFPPAPYPQYFQPPNRPYMKPHQVSIAPPFQFQPPSNSQPPLPPATE
ncbi:hypothetical protein PsorP6_000344 [Peronosclerospora sorghi]|uniref:Uncharacterized protein n=1 Tax=Peronosclerospora sorghi TaxID=230839 RepID=A0ACC0WSF3_9STRA|nr:hypothetical protein PsorP6_000344 [Peronosclerospora sorghi]